MADYQNVESGKEHLSNCSFTNVFPEIKGFGQGRIYALKNVPFRFEDCSNGQHITIIRS